MNVNRFKAFVLFVIKKSVSGGNPSPDNFNLAMERAYMAEIMKRYGNPKEYIPGQPIPRMAWQQNHKITDDLRFLLVKKTFPLTNGVLNVPNGTDVLDINSDIAPKYLHFSSLRYNHVTQKDGVVTQKEVDVRPIKDSEVGSAVSSHIAPPTTRFPVCSFYNTFIEVWPKDVQKVIFTYLRVPVTPVWAYTTVNSRPVYDAANSVDIDAPDDMINDIVSNLLSYLGVSIREGNFINWSEQMKSAGN